MSKLDSLAKPEIHLKLSNDTEVRSSELVCMIDWISGCCQTSWKVAARWRCIFGSRANAGNVLASNSVCLSNERQSELVVLNGKLRGTPAKVPQSREDQRGENSPNYLKRLVAEERLELPTRGL